MSIRSLARRIKRQGKSLLGKDLIVKEEVLFETLFLGSSYGGWVVIPSYVDTNSIIYSFGIGEDISFDLEMIELFSVHVYAFDPTPRSIAWVKQQDIPTSLHIYEYGLADFDGEIYFNPPENPDHVSHSILSRPNTHDKAVKLPVMTIDTIMKNLGHDHIDILKIDIEGAEYQFLEHLQRLSIRPKQLLVEFHHRFPGVGIAKTKLALSLLSNIGYKIFSVSESGEEYSFIYNP